MSALPTLTPEATTETPNLEAPQVTAGRKSSDERKIALAQIVQNYIVQEYRIESQTGEYWTVLVKGHRINHPLHLLISIVTIVWFFVWIALAITGGEKRLIIGVDEFGTVRTKKL